MNKELKPVKNRTKAGQFPKGASGNPKGRKPGTRNTKTLQWGELGECITATHATRFNDLLTELWTSSEVGDRVKAAELFLKTLDYFKPRLQRVDATVTEPRAMPRPIIVIRPASED